MIEMRVDGIALNAGTMSPVVMLVDTAGRRALPIWISQDQARAIHSALEDQVPPRPMTHDLMSNILDQCNLELERVVIHALHDSTYHALLRIRRGEETFDVDARPSDAIVLALKQQSSIWALEEVISSASVAADQDADEAERAEFRSFLSGLSPADFAQYEGRG
jgi:uncharacterized protein